MSRERPETDDFEKEKHGCEGKTLNSIHISIFQELKEFVQSFSRPPYKIVEQFFAYS